MGSPPPARRPRAGIDPKAFGSRPNTPVQTSHNNKINKPSTIPRSQARRPHSPDTDIIMPDAPPSSEEEEEEIHRPSSHSSSSDHDVDRLELDQPTQSHSHTTHIHQTIQSVPTPPLNNTDIEEDDDEALIAQLNAALEEEEDEQGRVYAALNGGGADEESEVSEEE